MDTQKIYNLVILDASGSMETIYIFKLSFKGESAIVIASIVFQDSYINLDVFLLWAASIAWELQRLVLILTKCIWFNKPNYLFLQTFSFPFQAIYLFDLLSFRQSDVVLLEPSEIWMHFDYRSTTLFSLHGTFQHIAPLHLQ